MFGIATVLAVISCFFVRPSAEYLNYINFRTLIILLVMMLAVQLLKALDVFDVLVGKLVSSVKTVRGLAFVLVFGCFFSSMLITNDVSLLSLVPFTIASFRKIEKEKYNIPVVILQTIAANMGCMLLPIGSPHNILMFSVCDMTLGTFIGTLLPYWLTSFVLLFALCFFLPATKVEPIAAVEVSAKKENVLKKTFSGVDYMLLLTFVSFFILIGNLKSMPQINSFFSKIFEGRELLCSILSCQIISNVPAAMMLNGFSENRTDILIGINIGGLGTLIASMANLISYKIYAHEFNESKGRFLLCFTGANLAFLVPMIVVYLVT